MSPELIAYLKENKWKDCDSWGIDWRDNWNIVWDKTLNSECHAYITPKDGGYVYGEDCPDVNMPIEDYFTDLFFEDEEKLIQFLEELKLTKLT